MCPLTRPCCSGFPVERLETERPLLRALPSLRPSTYRCGAGLLALGEPAEAFIRDGAAAGATMLPKEFTEIVAELQTP